MRGWAGVVVASMVLVGAAGCGDAARPDSKPEPEPVVAVRELTDPCEFLNEDERATLQLDPGSVPVADPTPSDTPTVSPSSDLVRLCIFNATEPYNRGYREYVASVTVSLMDVIVEDAREALDDNDRHLSNVSRVPSYAKVAGKPYYQREGARFSMASCERLHGIGSNRSIEVRVALDYVTDTGGTPCQAADRLAPLVEQKLIAAAG